MYQIGYHIKIISIFEKQTVKRTRYDCSKLYEEGKVTRQGEDESVEDFVDRLLCTD